MTSLEALGTASPYYDGTGRRFAETGNAGRNAFARLVHLLCILGSLMIFFGCQNDPAKAELSLLEAVVAESWPLAAFYLQYTEEYPLDYMLEILVDGNGRITTR